MMEARHQLAAIVFTDAVGSSQSMRENEERTLSALHEDLAQMREACEQHGGEVLKSTGDGLMMLFKSASQAVLCGLEIQMRLGVPEKGALQHRIGIHLGDVYLSEGDAHGDGVNVASRLQEIASPGCICLSKTVLDVARSRLQVQPKAIGVKQLKGIDEGIEIFEIGPRGKPLSRTKGKRAPNGLFLPAFGMVLLAGVAVVAFITKPWETKPPIAPIVQIQSPPPDKAQLDEEKKLESDLAALKQEQLESKKLASAPRPEPIASPRETSTPKAPPPTVPDATNPATTDATTPFASDTDKLATTADKATQTELSAPAASNRAMHLDLPGYWDQAKTHWATRDFQGMADWIRTQAWSTSPEGKSALRHWTLMSDFRDWYLSQMRLYSPDKPLSAVRLNGGDVKSWMLPGDVIAYTASKGLIKKAAFDEEPLWLISATFTAVLPDSQEPKKHVQGFNAMQVEQKAHRSDEAP